MQSYIESKGYSWILETEDELDDEPQRPLLEELEIDVGDIVTKARWALKPPADVGEINDFWGPAAVVMLYAALVVWGQMRVVSWILSLWVFGGGTVWFLARLLGADLTYAHTLGSLGYTTLPLVLARALVPLVGTAGPAGLAVRVVATAWSTLSATLWMRHDGLANKRALLAYPILLYFYFFIAVASGV